MKLRGFTIPHATKECGIKQTKYPKEHMPIYCGLGFAHRYPATEVPQPLPRILTLKLCSKLKHDRGALLLEAVPWQQAPWSRGLVRRPTTEDVASSVNGVVAQHSSSADSTPHIMVLSNSFRQEDSLSDVISQFRCKPIQAVEL